MYELFANILKWISSVIGYKWAWAVVLFTLVVRFIILPFDYKSRISMRKTQKLQPEIQKLQKKYANDKEKLNMKMSELYKKEKVNPLSSCLPMLLTMPILFCMWGGMRIVANEQTLDQVSKMLSNPNGYVYDAGNITTDENGAPIQPYKADVEGWLWIKNIMMPDSPFASQLPDANALTTIDANVFNKWILQGKHEVIVKDANGVETKYTSCFDLNGVVKTAAVEATETTAAVEATETATIKYITVQSESLSGDTPYTIVTVDAATGVMIGEPEAVNKAVVIRELLGAIGLEMDASGNVINRTKYYANSGVSTSVPLLFWTVNIMKDWNGLFLLPILSALSQLLMTKLNPSAPKKRDAQGNVIKDPSQPNTGAFMTWFFPLFSLWICAQYNGLFALYWVASNLVAMVETICINKYLDKKEAKTAALENVGSVK